MLDKSEIIEKARKTKTSFTRKRKMELRCFMSFFGGSLMTKQAYSKKRQNLNPEVFRILNDEYVKMMNDQRNDLKTYGYYYVLAVDGYNGLENSEKHEDLKKIGVKFVIEDIAGLRF